ncbi:alpha/beta hydrolase [Alcaligenes sp. SDU_A2]|uniref:alpha/beta hydrolase n=1 Tax=Alcaligenes sp. SDU_A2 TaxID=3136634 RepID=UPI00311DF3CE
MSERLDTIQFSGAAGVIDCALDWPIDTPRGWALILHPHPLHGGARDNKVVTTLSRCATQQGLLVVRPDFRGVGLSAGQFDQSRGETVDMLALIEQFSNRFAQWPDGPWLVAGFSFGTSVAAQVHAELADAGAASPRALVLAGTAVNRFRFRQVQPPADTLLVHGELDDVVPLSEGMEFAREHQLPMVVLPQAGHFFHGKLIQLRELVSRHLAGLGT